MLTPPERFGFTDMTRWSAGAWITLLIGNFSDVNVRLSPTSASYVMELNNSGVIHNEGSGTLQISTEITQAGGNHSITKTGEGILRFNRLDADRSTQYSTYAGGFTLREGIVEWTHSGNSSANPFGTGAMTLEGGTLRSTSDTGRTLTNSMVLDGGATFGSLEEGFRGDLTVNSVSGSRRTTLVADSTLTIHNQTTWHQSTTGDFALTKEGRGTLVFTGTGGDLGHTGGTTVAEGTLVANADINGGPVEVLDGATLMGTGVLDAPVTVREGATLGFGFGETGQMAIEDSLTMEAGSIISFNLDGVDSFDSLLVSGPLNLGGNGSVILDIDLGFAPDVGDVFLLLDNRSGVLLDGVFSFGGNTLAEADRFEVTTGGFSQLFEISYQHGGSSADIGLTAIPEPSTWGLLSGLAILGATGFRRHLRRERSKTESVF